MLTEKQSKQLKNYIWHETGVAQALTDKFPPHVVEKVNDTIIEIIDRFTGESISNVCISDGQAERLKAQIVNDNPDIMHPGSTIIQAIFKTIDDSVEVAINEPRQFHFKNIVAFIVLMRDSEFPDLHPSSILKKFERFCMSHKPDEYKWGIHPSLYGQLYQYFDRWNVELDTGEKLAKKHYSQDRRWYTENTESVEPEDDE